MAFLAGYTGAPSVEPDGTKEAYLRDSATPQAFGVGVDQAEQGLAQQLGQSAKVAGDIADNLQDTFNTAAATHLENNYNMAIAQRTAQHNQLTGINAINDAEPYQRFLQDTRQQIMGQAPNSAVARIVDPQLTRVATGLTQSSMNHVAAQTKQYNLDESNKRSSIATDNIAAADPNDTKAFQENLAIKELSAANNVKINGGGPADLEVALRQTRTEAYNTRWNTMVFNGHADAAMKEYEGARDKILDPSNAIYNSIDSGQKSQYIATTTRALATGELPSVKDRENYLMSELSSKYGKNGAAGLVGGLRQETANLDPAQDAGDDSGSHGIGQWRLDRLSGGKYSLETFAKNNNLNPDDIKTQTAFISYEIDNNPRFAGLGDKLRNAKTPEEAAQLANDFYEVSHDSPTGNARDQAGYANRVAHAQRLARADIKPPQGGITPDMSPTRITDLVNTARQLATAKFPDDPKVADQAEQAVRARYNLVKQDAVAAQQELTFSLKDSVFAPTDADPNAKPPTRQELMANPKWKSYYDALGQQPNGAELQHRIDGIINRNITSVPDTPERTQRFNELDAMSRADPQRFRSLDLSQENLTRLQASIVHQTQRKLNAKSDGDIALKSAIGYLDQSGFFRNAGIVRATQAHQNDDYDKFIGQLDPMIRMQQAQTGKPPSQQDITKMAASLVKPVPSTGMWPRSGWFSDYKNYQMDVPKDDPTAKAITDWHQGRYGRPPTPDELNHLYNFQRYKQATAQ